VNIWAAQNHGIDHRRARKGSHLSLRFNGHFPGEPGLAGVY